MKTFRINVKPENAIKVDRNTLILLYGAHYNKDIMAHDYYFRLTVGEYLNGTTQPRYYSADEETPFNMLTPNFALYGSGANYFMWDDEDVTIDTTNLMNGEYKEVFTLRKGHYYTRCSTENKSLYPFTYNGEEQKVYAQFEYLAELKYNGADIPRYGTWFLPVAYLETSPDKVIDHWNKTNQAISYYRIFLADGNINNAFTMKMWNCCYGHSITGDRTYCENKDFTDGSYKYGETLTADPVLNKGDVFKYVGEDLDYLTSFDSAFTEEMIANVKQLKHNHYYKVVDLKNCGENTGNVSAYSVLMVFFEDVTEEYIKKDKVWDIAVNIDNSKATTSYYENLLSAIADNEGRWGQNCDDDGNAICIDYGKGWNTTQPDSITKAVERLQAEYKPYMYSV